MCWELLLRVCAAIFSRERTMLVQAFSSFCDIHRMWSSTSMMLLAISTITSVSCEQSGRHQLRFAPVQPPPAANTPIHAFTPRKKWCYLLDLIHVANELLYHLGHVEDINHVREVGSLGRVDAQLVGQGQGVGGVDGHLQGGTPRVTGCARPLWGQTQRGKAPDSPARRCRARG